MFHIPSAGSIRPHQARLRAGVLGSYRDRVRAPVPHSPGLADLPAHRAGATALSLPQTCPAPAGKDALASVLCLPAGEETAWQGTEEENHPEENKQGF